MVYHIYEKRKNLHWIIWIILVEVVFVMLESHRVLIAGDHDHLVINVCYGEVIDAFVQFDEMHHHVVVWHDFFLVQVEELIDDYLPLHDANVQKTKLK